MYHTLQITRDKESLEPRRLICTTSNKIPERPYELTTEDDIPVEELNEIWKRERNEKIKAAKNVPMYMYMEDVVINTHECNYMKERFEYVYWNNIRLNEMIEGYPNTLKNYTGPKIQLNCNMNPDQPFLCTPLVVATYHSNGCNFMELTGKAMCTCGGQDTSFCSCLWKKFVKPKDDSLLREQNTLFEKFKKKIEGKALFRRELKNFAHQHFDLMCKYAPRGIDRDFWADFILPHQLRRFRNQYAHELAKLGFIIHYTSTKQHLWLEEGPFMYEGADRAYLNKIKKDPSKMTNKDDQLRCWMASCTKEVDGDYIRFHINKKGSHDYKFWRYSKP